MASPIKPPAQDSWGLSALKWVTGNPIPLKKKVQEAGAGTLSKMLASDEIAEGLNILSEKTLFVHPVQGVNILLAVIQKGRKQLDLETFHTLQVQFAAFIDSAEYAHLGNDDMSTLSALSKYFTALREEMAEKSDTEKAQCLAGLKIKLADIEQQVESLVEKGSIVGKAATTFWRVLISEAKKIAPFLFREPPVPSLIKPIERVPPSHSNWERSAEIAMKKLAENGGACLTLQAFCEGIAGLKADMELYRILIDNGKNGLRQRVLNHLKSQGVSWIRYVFIWCFFSIGYWFIHRYTQRAATAYLQEAFAYINNQKYGPLLDTTLQTVAQFYYEMNTKLRRTSNLNNVEFQQGLALHNAEQAELYKKIGNDLFKKAEINCIVAWLIKFFVGPPEELVKMGMTSFARSLHDEERGINHTLLNLLKRANSFHEAHAGRPSQEKHHSLRRVDLVKGLMTNCIEAALLTSCKTPSQVTRGVLYDSFPDDLIGNLLDQLPPTIIDNDKRAGIRALSKEDLVSSAIFGFADLVDELFQKPSLQQALCDGLMSASQIFSLETQQAQTPEQLDLEVRQHAVSLLNRIVTEKLQLPDEAAPYFTAVTTPYVQTFLTLISNSLHPALFQRLLAIYLTTS